MNKNSLWIKGISISFVILFTTIGCDKEKFLPGQTITPMNPMVNSPYIETISLIQDPLGTPSPESTKDLSIESLQESAIPEDSENLPTLTNEAASEVWQLSPDGHIYYNESELYGGLFTINTEYPEYVEAYWEGTIRGLWHLNSVTKNTAFMSQFPTEDSLIDHIKNGGGPVSNLWIPVIYPKTQRQFMYQATMQPVEGRVDLSSIAISIYKPTTEEIYDYSPSPARTKYISYLHGGEEVYIETNKIDDRTILSLSFRSDILMDSDYSWAGYDEQYHVFALLDTKSGEDNFIAASQLLKSWILRMESSNNDEETGDDIWLEIGYDSPILNLV
jgi:hypothetical protein